jgi:hypothetical protein
LERSACPLTAIARGIAPEAADPILIGPQAVRICVVLTNDDKISQKWSTRQFAMSGVPYDGSNGEVGTICLSLASRSIRLGKGGLWIVSGLGARTTLGRNEGVTHTKREKRSTQENVIGGANSLQGR